MTFQARGRQTFSLICQIVNISGSANPVNNNFSSASLLYNPFKNIDAFLECLDGSVS